MRPARRSLPALLIALLAMLCQSASVGAAHFGAAQASAAPFGRASIHLCMAPDERPPDHHAPAHHGMDCDHCPLCAAMTAHATLPAPPRVPRAQLTVRLGVFPLSAAGAPHRPAIAAAPPRGPPTLT